MTKLILVGHSDESMEHSVRNELANNDLAR